MKTTFFEGPCNWRRADLENQSNWMHTLSQIELREIDDAFKKATSSGKNLASLTKDDFPLPLLQSKLESALDQLENGLGVWQLKGLDPSQYTKQDLRFIYWGICLQMGTAVSQNKSGVVIGDVVNFGSDIHAQGRGYHSNQRLGFHTDGCDIVCLLVLRTAQAGGLSKIASSVAIQNEIARTRPDLLEVLYQPYPWSWLNENAPGKSPFYEMPIFTQKDGKFSCRYARTHLENSQAFPEAPRFTAAQVEAMKLIDDLAANELFHYSYALSPGDLQFLNNHVVLHSRTAFTDFEEADRKRHLLRIWLSAKNTRPLDQSRSPLFRDLRPGAVRGGFLSADGRISFETSGKLGD